MMHDDEVACWLGEWAELESWVGSSLEILSSFLKNYRSQASVQRHAGW